MSQCPFIVKEVKVGGGILREEEVREWRLPGLFCRDDHVQSNKLEDNVKLIMRLC